MHTDRTRDVVPQDAERWITEGETFVLPSGLRVAYRRRGQGRSVLLLHGFPTWSYDYAEVASDLEQDHEVITLDFMGYGASDKPRSYDYSVIKSADVVEQLLARLNVDEVDLVIHDYGSIVGQELLDRRRRGQLKFRVRTVNIFNAGIVYSAYRPTRLQRLLIQPVIGRYLASRVTGDKLRQALDRLRGDTKLTDPGFANLWHGISRENGHKLAHLHIRYNTERSQNHQRWEAATEAWDGPLHLIWGMQDPVSGRHVLDPARERLPHATVTELENVGHFPMSEAPHEAAAALRRGIDA